MGYQKLKRLAVLSAAALVLAGCSSGSAPEKETGAPEASVTPEETKKPEQEVQGALDSNISKEEQNVEEDGILMMIHPEETYQVLESFGTSGCWWSQYVGGWDTEYKDTGREVREAIAKLLFDKEEGIGLTCYRYNLGAGSKESGKGVYWDNNRRAASFETDPGVYDWNRDKNAIWFLRRAVELGVEEVVFFCNSPLERLTINKTAQVSKGEKSNLDPENYDDFAKYVLDVTEHFVEEGIPVRFVSPINEPQWDWTEGQEGCHYEPGRIAGVYRAFLTELNSRPALKDVELSGPESGEWKGDAIAYTSAILNDSVLSGHFKTIDNHSYWSDQASKKAFKRWMDANHPEVKLRMSEWCEMVNGSDVTMDSAIHLAQVLAEDLTVLNVVSWQNWVAVAPGGYRDGLIYVNAEKKLFNPLKRLWGYGNYSRYIRPGYMRIGLETTKEGQKLSPVVFTGTSENGRKELVIVLVNESKERQQITLDISGGFPYTDIEVFETSKEHDLACIRSGHSEKGADGANTERPAEVELTGESITTVVLSYGSGSN